MAAFADACPKTYRGSTYSVTRYDKQILEARVHLLPVNVKDSVLGQIFEGFGRVISITDEVNKYGAAYIKRGVRIVKVEVDEVGKFCVPHLLQFECGSRALVTVRGRPPLCLKCHRVGHLRSGCPGTVTNAGTGFQGRRETVRPVEKVDEVREEATGETVEKEMETVVEERTEEKAEEIEKEDDVVEEAEAMDVEVRGEKRSSSAVESGWVQISPNKKSGGSSGAGGAARVSDLTQELEAFLAEDPLTPGAGGAAGYAEPSRVTGFHYHFRFFPNDLYLVFTEIERNLIMDNDFSLIPQYLSRFGWFTFLLFFLLS